MKPLIAIMTRCEENEEKTSMQYVHEFVRTTIIKAKGEPFFLTPPQNLDYFKTKYDSFKELTEEEKNSIDFWLDAVNGLFIPGGIKFTEYDRYILEQAIKKDIPTLAVCLGMQLMSCYKDEVKLCDVPPSDINQNQKKEENYAHTVTIDKNSKLYQIVKKEKLMVNSFHKKCASENKYYEVVAQSDDGVIEALEYSGKSFHIGLQWHPEKMYDYDEDAKKIIDAFIEESSKRRTNISNIRSQYEEKIYQNNTI